MLPTAAAASSNAKLRDLLQTARELLRRRHLKKALTNAQIAEDFAARSREAPGVVVAARLLRAEIWLVNAAFTHDLDLRARAQRIIEQVETDTATLAADADVAVELHYVRGRAQLLDANYERAAALFALGLQALPPGDPRRARYAVGLAESRARCLETERQPPSDRADERSREALDEGRAALAQAPDAEALAARLDLIEACFAKRRGDLGIAIDAAHQAKRRAAAAADRETEALASFFLGRLSKKRGNAAIALRFFYEGMDLAEGMGHRPLLVDTHLEIGGVFAALANDREAAKYFAFAADDAADSGRTDVVYAASYALGVASLSRGDLPSANRYLGAALQAANALEWPREQGVALGELAAVKFAEQQHGLAGHLAHEARRCANLAGGTPSAKTALTQARLSDLAGDHPHALGLATEAEQRAAAEGREDLRAEAIRLRARSLTATGELAAALAAERTASEVWRRLLDQQRDRHLPDLDMRAALRRREREIEKLTREAELKNALVAKTDEIERANRDLVQVNEELRQFAYVASHDLKEPLRQIGSYVGLIRRRYGDDLDARGAAYFGYVSDGVARLNRLLDSLMRYTSVARLEVRYEPVAVERVIAEVERELAAAIAEAGAAVVTGDLPTLVSSAALLRHVLAALLDNAVKFRRPGVSPEVEVNASVADDTYVLSVRDNGIGIDPAYGDKVFVLFQMLHAKSDYPGTGVGLAIAQKTVQRLGGRIYFEPNADGTSGTTFTIELPTGSHDPLPAELRGGASSPPGHTSADVSSASEEGGIQITR